MRSRTRLSYLFSPLVVAAFFLAAGSASVQAQIHGVPASVTSFGFGGSTSSTPGVAASVTSLGPNGFGGGHAHFNNCCSNAFVRFGGQMPNLNRGHHSRRNFFAGTVPIYGIPYTQVVVVQPDEVADDEDDDSGGPTIFDRRGRRPSSWRRNLVAETAPAPVAPSPVAAAPPAPVVAQPSTVLVYRDGHQGELVNYAIVGDTIFDLTDNRTHKILLADIDLSATRKANDARGVDFQVPAQ